MARSGSGKQIGNWLGPPRFLVFFFLLLVLALSLIDLVAPAPAFLLAFDMAALVFIASVVPLFRGAKVTHMRDAAKKNDANRAFLLVISAILSIAVLCAIAVELSARPSVGTADVALVVGSLATAWVFGNLIYTLHYAHIFYLQDEDGKDTGGINFPATPEPDYWDFLYFAFTLGMTFQTSDMDIESKRVRRIAVFHCAAAFVFNIGVLAFSINLLGN